MTIEGKYVTCINNANEVSFVVFGSCMESIGRWSVKQKLSELVFDWQKDIPYPFHSTNMEERFHLPSPLPLFRKTGNLMFGLVLFESNVFPS